MRNGKTTSGRVVRSRCRPKIWPEKLHEDPHDHGGLDHRRQIEKKQNTAVSAPIVSMATSG